MLFLKTGKKKTQALYLKLTLPQLPFNQYSCCVTLYGRQKQSDLCAQSEMIGNFVSLTVQKSDCYPTQP